METTDDKELEPLKRAIWSELESNGSLNEIRAHLRENVFRVCDNSYDNKQKIKSKSIEISDENVLINELIREYFKFNDYKHSLNVFNCETGQQNHSNIDRLSVQNKLKVDTKDEEINKLPLLNTIIKHFLSKKATTL